MRVRHRAAGPEHRARAQPLLSSPLVQSQPATMPPPRNRPREHRAPHRQPPPVRPEHLHVPAGHRGPAGTGRADRPGNAGLSWLRAAADQHPAGTRRAPLRGRAPRRLPRRTGPRDLLRSRDRACGARAFRPGRPRSALRAHRLGRCRGPLRRDHGMPAGRAGLLFRAPRPAHAGHLGGDRTPGRTAGAAAGRPRGDLPGRSGGPAGSQHRGPGGGGPAARHPGPPDGGPQPAPPGLRLPSPAALGGAHPEDLRGGR